MDAIHTETKAKCTLEIIPDENYDQSPDEWGDDSLFLVGFHRAFTVKRDKIVTQGQCRAIFTRDPEDDEKEIAKELKKQYHVFGLEAYIHSGVVLVLSHEGNFVDRQWDVSQLGAVFVSKAEWKDRANAKKAAQGLVKTWNDCLSGNVYGFIVKDERGETLDSCWGYIGDWEKSGVLEEGKSALECATTKKECAKRAEQYRKADIEQAEKLLKPYNMKAAVL
jgi:hypothetical protein